MNSLDWIPFARGVRVLAQHPVGLVAVEKPAGVMAHPNPGEKGDGEAVLIQGNYSMEEEAFHIRDGAGGMRRVYLLNRLDSPTSGVLLLSLEESLADKVKKLFAQHQVTKRYLAVVRGRGLRTPRGTWQDVLTKSKGAEAGVRSAVKSAGGAPAITLYRWERAASDGMPLSLLQLEPRTGRTHQLRVQTAKHGHPILGDRTYGDFDFNKTLGTARGFKRLFLHACETEFTVDWAGQKIYFKAVSPMPEEFAKVLGDTDGDRPAKLNKPKPVGTKVSPRLRVRL